METATNKPTPLPIPNGWFAVAWSKDLVAGDVLRARYFDEELVVFRTRSGEVKVLNAYCPHLGAHLAEGGRVACRSMRWPPEGSQEVVRMCLLVVGVQSCRDAPVAVAANRFAERINGSNGRV